MSIKCLFHHHQWRFGYNHGIALGSGMSHDEIQEGFKDGSIYRVDGCARKDCEAQSKMVDGKRMILAKNERQRP